MNSIGCSGPRFTLALLPAGPPPNRINATDKRERADERQIAEAGTRDSPIVDRGDEGKTQEPDRRQLCVSNEQHRVSQRILPAEKGREAQCRQQMRRGQQLVVARECRAPTRTAPTTQMHTM